MGLSVMSAANQEFAFLNALFKQKSKTRCESKTEIEYRKPTSNTTAIEFSKSGEPFSICVQGAEVGWGMGSASATRSLMLGGQGGKPAETHKKQPWFV